MNKSLHLPNPINQSLFTVSGFQILDSKQITTAELSDGIYKLFVIDYQLHEGFDLKALFDPDRGPEFFSREVFYDLLDPLLEIRTRFILQGLSLHTAAFRTDARSTLPLSIRLTYSVNRIV